ncbi:MAG: DUF4149 domain-containing protein [Aquificae bacterium]|nr:DUF4149 domain-containing protein [Aquificota bacterium]
MNKYIQFSILLLTGYLLGASVFFTFIVAPSIFSHFDTRLAAEITNTIFPIYFASGWIIGLVIYTLVAVLSIKDKFIVKRLKWFIILVSVLIISFMALHKAVLPIGQTLNNQYYALIDKKKPKEAQKIKEKFSKVHIISSSLNLGNIMIEIFLFYSFFNYIYTRKEEKDSV